MVDNYENIAEKYYNKFGEEPPRYSTLDVENKDYLSFLKDAILNNTKITVEDLSEEFANKKDVVY